ncbi:MAG: hypothetical protein DMD56_14065, partial [Gemmatimonadetes bacterium]
MPAGALEIHLEHQLGDQPRRADGREVLSERKARVLERQRRGALEPRCPGVIGHFVEGERRELGSRYHLCVSRLAGQREAGRPRTAPAEDVIADPP